MVGWHHRLNGHAAAKSLQSCPILCDPIDGSPPGSPSLGFSRQEYWSGLPFPSPMHESERWKWSRSWVWVNSGSWWWTERPGVLQSMGSQRVRHNWATELNNFNIFFFYSVLRMKSLNFLSNWNPFKIWNLFFKKPIRRKCIIPEINRKTWFHLVKKSNRSLLLSKKVKSILET